LTWQLPPSQTNPIWQSALVMHRAPQELPWQTVARQARELPGWQTPDPSQVRAEYSVEPLQLPGTHSVPAG
jgi:hypothetical protein